MYSAVKGILLYTRRADIYISVDSAHEASAGGEPMTKVADGLAYIRVKEGAVRNLNLK
jgi:hypothetical protein